MSPLRLTHRDTAAGPVLLVVGELDFVHAAELRRQVERLVLHRGQCLVLDLSGLEFCDSTGITALLAARQRTLAADAELVLAAVPSHLERILTIVGLVRVFTLRATAEDE